MYRNNKTLNIRRKLKKKVEKKLQESLNPPIHCHVWWRHFNIERTIRITQEEWIPYTQVDYAKDKANNFGYAQLGSGKLNFYDRMELYRVAQRALDLYKAGGEWCYVSYKHKREVPLTEIARAHYAWEMRNEGKPRQPGDRWNYDYEYYHGMKKKAILWDEHKLDSREFEEAMKEECNF